jgi:GWxTD domain-containing protein
MILSSIIRVAVLLILILCTEPLLGQDEPLPNDKDLNPVAIGVAPESQYHHCFEKPNNSKEAIRRLPQSARYWLAEDAIYLITPEERCAFLHLNSDEERERFIDQFWYRRSVDPISLDYDFKTEFYRRIVVANEKYGSKLLAGRNTDRGRVYVIFGPPDSVDENSHPVATHSIETWHYHYIKGIGENAQIHFEYTTRYDDYVFPDADRDLVGQAEPNPDPFPVTPESIGLHIHPERTPKTRFKDLEVLLVSQMVRNEVKFSEQIKYSPATRATTLARIDVQIPCETCTRDGQTAVEYPLFVRVSKPSGWVVSTSELVAGVAGRNESDSSLTLTAHLDVPLAPGMHQLAIAIKNPTTGDAGVLRTRMNVPTYELLGAKK